MTRTTLDLCLLLLLGGAFTACSDQGTSSLTELPIADPAGPTAPVNPDDGSAFGGNNPPVDPAPGDGGGDPLAGGNPSPTPGTSTSGSGRGTRGPEGGSGQPGGGGAPVPEPTTMLLVGTGLAGAAMMRRRRRQDGRPDDAAPDATES